MIPKKYQKIVTDLTKYDENNTYIKLIEDFINKELDRRSKINGDIYTLGEIN